MKLFTCLAITSHQLTAIIIVSIVVHSKQLTLSTGEVQKVRTSYAIPQLTRASSSSSPRWQRTTTQKPKNHSLEHSQTPVVITLNRPKSDADDHIVKNKYRTHSRSIKYYAEKNGQPVPAPFKNERNPEHNNKMLTQLSTIIRDAADVVNLFEGIKGRERAIPLALSDDIRRRQVPSSDSVPIRLNAARIQKSPALQQWSNPRSNTVPSKLMKNQHDEASKAVANGGGDQWLEVLFGPRGVLSALFQALNNRRKQVEQTDGSQVEPHTSGQSGDKIEEQSQSDLSLLPDFLVNAKPIDFTKIFEAFLTGGKGDFDERISNLPEILGICNRLSCGDIYKAIDEFRRSEFFSNFQTALQLIQDPKGWEMFGSLLSNPDLVAQLTGGNGDLAGLFGSAFAGSTDKNHKKEIVPGDGDLGTDFGKMFGINSGKEKKPTAEELPEIAENVDAIDYYNAIESGIDVDGGGAQTVRKPDVVARVKSFETTTMKAKGSTQSPKLVIDKRPSMTIETDIDFPEISESIDEHSESVDLIIDQTTPKSPHIHFQNRSFTTGIRLYTASPWSIGRTTNGRATVDRARILTTSGTLKTKSATRAVIVRTLMTTTPSTAQTKRVTTISRRLITTTTKRPTTKNFREDSDYYAMYYDG